MKDAYTSPRAARKITLSRRPATASRPRIGPDLPHRQHTDGGAERRHRSGAVGEQRHDEHDQQRAVQQHVQRCARGALGQRYPVGPRWQPNGVGPQPVQDRPHRREEPVVQRAEPASEADDLEQHGVEHDLLEHDRFGPPVGDVGESVDALGGEREQPAAENVEQDLDDVEQVHDDRRAEADLGPVLGHRPDLLGARALAPLGEVDDGHVGLEKSHGRKTRTCSSRWNQLSMSDSPRL